MQQNAPTRSGRISRLWSLIHVTGLLGFVVLGCALAVLGFALVLDVLSLRELLVQYGPGSLGRLTMAARARMEHPGAQAGELATGLTGLIFVVLGAYGLITARR